jgi:hypothetical protein
MMLLKVFAGVLVAVAVVITGAALMGYNGHCPFSHGCCDAAAAPPVSETAPAPSCCSTESDCCTSPTAAATTDSCPLKAAEKKAECCEEAKVAGEK